MLDSPLPESALRDALRARLADRARSAIPVGSAGAESATLACLFERDGDTHVWLTKRPESMRRHGGQVSFPGGRRDPTDATLLETALREAGEELGLPADQADVLGPLDDVVTFTGYVITPYVAWLRGPFVPEPDPVEVARAFSAPLRVFSARARGVFPKVGWQVEGELVWGATAAVLHNLVAVVRELPRPPGA
ncbi:MAG: CoA pyrophosphatase [Myxococcales bacterium]|nr:CoA pyrophosphatase [Myxococcales bacterium]